MSGPAGPAQGPAVGTSQKVPDITYGGRSSRVASATAAVAATFRLAKDKLSATSMLLRGGSQAEAASEQLVAAWRAVAEADELPASPRQLDALCCTTMAAWPRLQLGDKILMLDCWGVAQQTHSSGGRFSLPRPLLRAMATSMWVQGSEATAQQLNRAAVRTAPFMNLSDCRDLARSLLDAAIQAAATLVTAASNKQQQQAPSPRPAASFAALLGMAAHASRTNATQRHLAVLRQAASLARNPAEDAIRERVAWMKSAHRCDSVTAHSRIAAQLARDSLERGGDLRATFIKAFGHIPEAEQVPDNGEEGMDARQSSTAQALAQWQRELTDKVAAARVAAGEAPVAISTLTVQHCDGRSQAATQGP